MHVRVCAHEADLKTAKPTSFHCQTLAVVETQTQHLIFDRYIFPECLTVTVMHVFLVWGIVTPKSYHDPYFPIQSLSAIFPSPVVI